MPSPRRNIAAVIFDMDGVLLDSMPYHYLAWFEALYTIGVRVSCLDVFAHEGEQWEHSLNRWLQRAGKRPTEHLRRQLFRRRERIFSSLFKPRVFAGAEETLSILQARGYRLALVTGTPRSAVENMLPVRIHRRFDVIVSGDEVRPGKPHPAPFLRAAKLMGVKPAACQVVENAPMGIRAARAAGMQVCAVATSLPPAYLRDAHCVLEQVGDVLPLCPPPKRIRDGS